MSWLSNFITTSVGRKQLMAVTGLMLSGFLVTHLSGNMLLFLRDDGESFNAYAAWLTSQFWLVPAEIGLVAVFLLHMFLAWTLTRMNRKARGLEYQYKEASGATLASRTMILSGVLILVFIVIHLVNFKYADHHGTGGLYGVVVGKLAQPSYSLYYMACMVILAFHIGHGIQSVFQTFGIFHPKHTPLIKKLCLLLAIVLSVGFASIPLWFLVTQGDF